MSPGWILWMALWACGAPAQDAVKPPEVAVKGPCTAVRLAANGLVTVAFADKDVTGHLVGIRLKDDRKADLEALLGRLPSGEGRLDCKVDAAADPPGLVVTYFGWQDKSGDVHLDLAETLVAEGLAEKE